jgi:hypothetical protein
MDLQTLYAKLDKMDEKLDSHLERITRVEEQHRGMRGQIQIGLALIGTTISAIITYVTSKLLGN